MQLGKIKNIDIRGGYMISDGKLLKCKPGEYSSPEKWGFSNLKKLPLIDYFKMQNKEQVVLTISRGCLYNCCYCNAVSYYGVSERRRPIEDIINFINSNEYIYYKFFAPNFTLNEKETFKLCEALIKNEKKIKWSCTTRPDLLKNELLIKKMSQAGCYKIAVGIESIEESDLLNIKKQYDLNNMIQGINLLKKYNIEYKALIMFGVPNQTKTGIEYTLDFLYKNGLNVRPTAYTPFYKLSSDMSEAEIALYDKRTYYEGINDLSYGDFLRLIYDTKNYKKILKAFKP